MKGVIQTVMFAACVGAAFGVKCYVGTSSSETLKDCGASSDKCVKSVSGGTVAKDCHIEGLDPPGFTMSAGGCSEINLGGRKFEHCVCSGDGCNGSTKASVSTVLALLLSAVAGYLMM